MNETNYHYSDSNNKPVGPVTLEQLRQLARDGVINNQTNVIVEGTSNWIRYGDVAAGQQSRSADDAPGEFSWGASFFGLFLVVGQFFKLPYTLIKQAVTTLSAWGKSKVLPTAQSDVPVLTFVAVVTRPAVHVIFCIVALVVVSIGAFNTYGAGAKVGSFVLGVIAIYFANSVIGLYFDGVSLLVNLANNVKKIAGSVNEIERRK